MSKNIILTGSTGFIGSHLLNCLCENGYTVYCLVSKKFESPKNGKIIYCICNYDTWNAELPDIEYEAFIHLGWGGVDNKEKNDKDLQVKNLYNSIAALDKAYFLKCKCFIGIGTVAEYSLQNDIIDYTLKQAPNDIYGACKTATHYILETIARQRKQDFIWVILPSTFGPGRSEDNILTYTIKKLLNSEKPAFGKLEQKWDFLYVSEVARALVCILEKGNRNDVYGIGSGEFHSLREYIEKIRDLINPELPLGIGERMEESEKSISSCVSIRKLQQDTGFVPKISFEEGIKITIDFYKK